MTSDDLVDHHELHPGERSDRTRLKKLARLAEFLEDAGSEETVFSRQVRIALWPVAWPVFEQRRGVPMAGPHTRTTDAGSPPELAPMTSPGAVRRRCAPADRDLEYGSFPAKQP